MVKILLKETGDIPKQQEKLWLEYYNRCGIDITTSVTTHELLLPLTMYDFLFNYTTNENNEMCLIVPTEVDLELASAYPQIIGRIYSVGGGTHFEIPDFVIYKMKKHSGYTKNGIIISGCGGGGSDGGRLIGGKKGWICLSTYPSQHYYGVSPQEYYYNNILFEKKTQNQGENIYNLPRINVLVNREKKYGMVWFPKCGCTTIASIFCFMNKIQTDQKTTENKKMINYYETKYRYHPYLEDGIEHWLIVIRNPYNRFISTFVDKFIFQTDPEFIKMEGYKDCGGEMARIEDVINYIQEGGYITDHFLPLKYLFQRWQSKITKEMTIVSLDGAAQNTCAQNTCAQNNCAQQIILFFEKFMKLSPTDKEYILSCRENATHVTTNIQKLYNYFLRTTEIKKELNEIYKDDFIFFGEVFGSDGDGDGSG